MNADPQSRDLDPDTSIKLSQLREQLRRNFGKVVLALMGAPRYQHQTLADLQGLVLDPLIRNRVALAYSKETDEVSAVALWASVSSEVDEKIRHQIKAGIWPVQLGPKEWTSGEINWLFDVVSPDPETTSRVLARISEVIKDGDLRLHPLIAKLVDDEMLEKLGAATDSLQAPVESVAS